MAARSFIGLAIVLAVRAAGADAPRAIAIANDAGTCPTASDVTAALAAIFPDLQTATADDPSALHVELTARPDGLHVRAGDVERDFTGDDCAERARKAAVFVALVLAPPTIDAPTPAPPPAPVEPAAPVAAVTRAAVVEPHRESPSAPPWLQLDLAAAVEAAPRDANNLWTSGAELGVFIGGERLGAVVTVAGLAPADMQLGSNGASLTRLPAAFGIRGRTRKGRIGFAADAALTTSLLIVRGLDAMGASSDRLELGARVVARVEFWAMRRVAVFGAAQLDMVPATFDLVLPSAGDVGSTPALWVGGVIGVSAGFP